MSEVAAKAVKEDTTLKKGMSFWQIWAFGVGSVVGDGLFIYLGQGVQTGGPVAILAVAFAGFMQMAIMLAMGELAVGMPSAGAMTFWCSKYLNRFCGLFAGMTFSVSWIVFGGSTSIALGTIMAYWAPIGGQAFATLFWAVIWWSVFAVLNIAGVSIASNVQLFLVVVLVGIMAVFGIAGVVHGLNMDNFTPFAPFGFKGFANTIPIACFAFMGAATICTCGNECRDPRDLGKSLFWASLTFIIVYCLAMVVVIGAVNWQDQSLDVSLFTLAAKTLWGPVGGTILNIAAWIAAATCLISGSLYTPSRVFFGMAEVGYMPKVFAKVNSRTRTPVRGLVIIWACGMILILAGAKWGASLVYTTLVNQGVVAWTLGWILAIIAGIKYRRELRAQGVKDIKAHIGWKQPLYPVTPIIALASSVYLLYLCLNGVVAIVGMCIWLAAFCLYYWRIKTKVKAGELSEDVYF
ncbi:MAG: amino acid permease [Hornefia butyriciproducens]|uniref:APC family permease n=1 Tax=Hornefia butyriciproducens TaxID=2652293 RepID=UPI002A7517FF|nr:amino acid permease [Hornefia butyriciproducens]MCI7326520.1 amino acid permease [Clostridiales bacterium]MDY2990359.1 amino acid permease [Hornefia butyriciproducens]